MSITRARFTVGRADRVALYKHLAGESPRHALRRRYLALLILGAFFLAGFILAELQDSRQSASNALWLLTALGLGFAVSWFLHYPGRCWSRGLPSAGALELVAEADELVVGDGAGAELSIARLERVRETERHLLLLQTRDRGFAIPKATLEGATAVEVLEAVSSFVDAESDTARCGECGITTTVPGLFAARRRKDGSDVTVCPKCAAAHDVRKSRKGRRDWLITAAALIFLALWMPYGWFLLNLLLIAPAVLVSVLLHELAHAGVARLVGFRVFGIVLGIGKEVLSGRWLGLRWQINQFWEIGYVESSTRNPRFLIPRYVMFVLAGAAANLTVAAVGIFVLTRYGEDFARSPAPVSVLVFTNLFMGLANLIPFKTRFGLESDGALALASIKQPVEQTKRVLVAYHLLAFRDAWADKEYERALAAAEAGVAKHPEHFELRCDQGTALLQLSRVAEAAQVLRQAIEIAPNEDSGAELTEAEAVFAAIARNNLAYAILLLGDPGDFDVGAEQAAEAYAVCAWPAATAHTHAAYRLYEGEHEAAIEILERVVDEEDMLDKDRKSTLCTLALAYLHRGDPTKAIELEKRAESLGPDHRFDTSLRQAIAQVEQGSPPPRFLKAAL